MISQYRLRPDWPPGAWLAVCRGSNHELVVEHGPSVVTGERWFGEIVWDGDYTVGRFDQTDVVYGSGGTKTDEGVCFAASATTTDRLVSLEQADKTLVSNSLVCLIAAADAQVDPLYPHYRRDLTSIIRGLDRYQRTLPTSVGPVELTYYDHLLWDGTALRRRPKPAVARDLSTYEKYRDFLIGSLQALRDNMQSPDRPRPYDWLGTISTGFDSPTAAALAREAGLEEAITFADARGGASDDGSQLAKALGVRCEARPRNAWQTTPLAETSFIASDGKGEDVYLAGFADRLPGRVLLTGFGASAAWSASAEVNPQLCRSDASGHSLTEYRLWADFIHAPLPLLGLRSATPEDRRRLVEDLKAWRSGKSYDKPFCRRVLRERGVPDELYGQSKKAASVLTFQRNDFLSEASREDYLRYLETLSGGPRQRVAQLLRHGVVRGKAAAVGLLQAAARVAAGERASGLATRVGKSERLGEIAGQEPLAEYLFPWALGHARQRYEALDADPIKICGNELRR